MQVPFQVACPNCGQVNMVDMMRDEQARCGACQALLPWHMVANDETLQQLLQRPILNLLKFTSQTCAPCKQQTPVLKQVCVQVDRVFPGQLRVIEADLDVCPRAARAWQVSSVPATFLVRGGNIPTVLGRFDGLNEPGRFLERILDVLGPQPQSNT